MINSSGKTAITRKTLSLPMKWLEKHNMLACNRPNRRLDYGCGKGFDADTLGFQKYDLNHFPTLPQGKFDVITCIYVLNVIPDVAERQAVCDNILDLLADCGTAYIAVRNDLDALKGTTSKGTWQGNVEPPRHPWGGPVYKCAGFRLYAHTKL